MNFKIHFEKSEIKYLENPQTAFYILLRSSFKQNKHTTYIMVYLSYYVQNIYINAYSQFFLGG